MGDRSMGHAMHGVLELGEDRKASERGSGETSLRAELDWNQQAVVTTLPGISTPWVRPCRSVIAPEISGVLLGPGLLPFPNIKLTRPRPPSNPRCLVHLIQVRRAPSREREKEIGWDRSVAPGNSCSPSSSRRGAALLCWTRLWSAPRRDPTPSCRGNPWLAPPSCALGALVMSVAFLDGQPLHAGISSSGQ